MRIKIQNGLVITPYRIFRGGIIINGDKIEEVFKSGESPAFSADKIIEARGNYIAPGFIDIHTHGGGSYDFMDGSPEAIVKGAQAHMAFGTTSIIPTTLASTEENLFDTLSNFEEAKEQNKQGPNLPGIHLEGPYFSLEQKGAQDKRYLRSPDSQEYQKVLSYSNEIIRWSLAPELENALEMGRALSNKGILASIAHSNAVYEEVLNAFENGFTHVTHLYSGMSSVRRIDAYRYAGVVESSYLINEMTVEIIADGKHLPGSLLKLIYQIKGPDKICLITDSMRAAGMPEGEYILGSKSQGQPVMVEDGVAKLQDRSAFAGSVATADRLVRTMINCADISLKDAVRMITLTPARVMGIDKDRGSIAVGKNADIVIFDENIQVSQVFVNGSLLVSSD